MKLKALLFLGAFVQSVHAVNYTFNPNTATANWSDESAWFPPGGPPGPTDTATILADKICIVGPTNMEHCQSLTVNAGGVLAIDRNNLMIGDNSSITPGGTSTINGTIEFLGDAGSVLQFGDEETITGTGEIRTDPTNLENAYGELFWLDGGSPLDNIYVTGSLKLRGSIRFHIAMSVSQNVKFYADHSSHFMAFGPATNYTYDMKFGGELHVSAGMAQIQRADFNHPENNGLFSVTGGTLWLIRLPLNAQGQPDFGATEVKPDRMAATRLRFTVGGAGTLDDMITLGAAGLDMKETGTFKLLKEKLAVFSP